MSAEPYKVADIHLADFGRKEIQLAEHEMPGLMATRAEYAASQPLRARITGSLHDHPDRRRPDRDPGRAGRLGPLGQLQQHLLHQDHAAAASSGPDRAPRTTPRGVPVFAWKGETLEDYCTEQGGPDAGLAERRGAWNMILDRWRRRHPRSCTRALSTSAAMPRSQSPSEDDSEKWRRVILDKLRDSLADAPGKWTKAVETIKGVTEETTTGVHRPLRRWRRRARSGSRRSTSTTR